MLLALLLTLTLTTSAPAEFITLGNANDDRVHYLIPIAPRLSEDGAVDVLVHLKGSPALVAEQLERTDHRPLVVVVSDPGFSSAYRKRFETPAALEELLKPARLAYAGRHGKVPSEGRLLISSFSAGYGGVRELLKDDDWFDRIDGLLMLDSIHASFAEPDVRGVNAEQMAGFVRFAEAAAAGEKTMILVHARYAPPDYASTMETADHILEEIDLAPRPADVQLTEKLHVFRSAERGGFQLIGTSADDGSDHGPILSSMHVWLTDLFAKTAKTD